MNTVKDTQGNTEPEGLLEEYGDLFLEMEGTLESFEILYTDIGFAMDDIRDEMERLQEYLDSCSAALRAYRRRNNRKALHRTPGKGR